MNNTKVCILDYGSGNVNSVLNLINFLGFKTLISNKNSDLESATHLILPGVGSFGSSMEKIKNNISIDILEEQVLKKGKPFIGICVGMQILAEKGHEHGVYEGLGWIKGEVKKLDSKNLPLPHIGWNHVDINKETILLKNLHEYKTRLTTCHDWKKKQTTPKSYTKIWLASYTMNDWLLPKILIKQ